mgnify:CR=1 FL=1
MKRAMPIAAAAAAAVLLLALPPFLKNYGVYLLSYWLVFVVATMGLNLTIGYAGQKSLGHAAFFGIGAYTVAILTAKGISFWLALPLAVAECFVVGLALGFPALRVQTIYLAFATLGFNTALWLVMRNEEWLTGGTFGINNIGRPSLFGLSLDGNLAYYYFVLGVTVLMGLLQWKLLSSPWGKAFTALRDNPIRAESLGIHIQGYTLLSFAIGAVYAVEDGRTNPFLHLSMHLSIEEQCGIDQPTGIRQAVQLLAARRQSMHAAHHEVMECLGEMLWTSQRSGLPPDGQAYIEAVRRRATR